MSLFRDALFTPQSTEEPPDNRTSTKRTKDEAEKVELDGRPFTIRPDVSDPFGAPQVLTPICLLRREQLPLAYLDTSSNRLFSTHLPVLEILGHGDETSGILVVRDEKDLRLYAIERADGRTYALCKLAVWVKQDLFTHSAAIAVNHVEHIDHKAKRRALQPADGGQPWWTRAVVPVPDAPFNITAALNTAPLELPRLAMMRDASKVGTATLRSHNEDNVPGPAEATIDDDNPQVPIDPSPASAADSLQDLAKQYQEALYLSRTPLAYFTKGPMSRARAAFSGSEDDQLKVSELTAFLRDAILTASAVDKKYKDAMTGAVKDLAPTGLDTPEQLEKTRKKKRKWKAKRDKSGFFSDEKEYVERWWRAHDDSHDAPSSAETIDAGLKRRLPWIRSRETYMQVILALEVLALEATSPVQPEAVAMVKPELIESQAEETQPDESQTQREGKKQKAKKPQDLPGLLEVLLDRLCIWHSLDAHSPAKKAARDDGVETESSDELKSFCIEVIVPFYMSRIPQHAATVNKKLGGPSAPTPIKRKSTSSRKPGEPAIRQHPPERKPRKPLSRVSTETLNHHTRPVPSLHRSATDSDLLQQHIKREASEAPAPLDSIPASRPPHQRKRTSLMHSISFNRREVDLSAMSQSNTAKMRKKAEVEEKLKEAITALKKPNRALAVKEVAENADMSFAKAMAKSRPSARPKTVPHNGVHVTATPKHGRTVKATPGRQPAGLTGGQSKSGATSCVPASSARLQAPAAGAAPSSSFAVPQTGHRPRYATATAGEEETPSRGFAKFMPAGLARMPGTLESPIAMRRAAVEQTPVKPIRSLSLVPPWGGPLVEESPNAVRLSPHEHPAKSLKDGGGGSIYATLGWDDEYEQLT